MQVSFRIKSLDPNAVCHFCIRPKKGTKYSLIIRGREIYSTKIHEEIEILSNDSLIEEVPKKDLKDKVKDAEIVEEVTSDPVAKVGQAEKVVGEKK